MECKSFPGKNFKIYESMLFPEKVCIFVGGCIRSSIFPNALFVKELWKCAVLHELLGWQEVPVEGF